MTNRKTKTGTTTESGSEATTQPTFKTSRQRRTRESPPEVLTPKDYIAGCALTALMITAPNAPRQELINQAKLWSRDYFK